MLGVVVVFNNCTKSPTWNICDSFVVISASLPSLLVVPAHIPHVLPSVLFVNNGFAAVPLLCTCNMFHPKNLVIIVPLDAISKSLSFVTRILYNASSSSVAAQSAGDVINVFSTVLPIALIVPVISPAMSLNVVAPIVRLASGDVTTIALPNSTIVTVDEAAVRAN